MEVIARNEYMAGENRDPTACALFYFALGKARLVHGLWRQAAWHKEQAVMLKFLSNDFQEERWKTAAMKNAYALMSKQRFGTQLHVRRYMTLIPPRSICRSLFHTWRELEGCCQRVYQEP